MRTENQTTAPVVLPWYTVPVRCSYQIEHLSNSFTTPNRRIRPESGQSLLHRKPQDCAGFSLLASRSRIPRISGLSNAKEADERSKSRRPQDYMSGVDILQSGREFTRATTESQDGVGAAICRCERPFSENRKTAKGYSLAIHKHASTKTQDCGTMSVPKCVSLG